MQPHAPLLQVARRQGACACKSCIVRPLINRHPVRLQKVRGIVTTIHRSGSMIFSTISKAAGGAARGTGRCASWCAQMHGRWHQQFGTNTAGCHTPGSGCSARAGQLAAGACRTPGYLPPCQPGWEAWPAQRTPGRPTLPATNSRSTLPERESLWSCAAVVAACRTGCATQRAHAWSSNCEFRRLFHSKPMKASPGAARSIEGVGKGCQHGRSGAGYSGSCVHAASPWETAPFTGKDGEAYLTAQRCACRGGAPSCCLHKQQPTHTAFHHLSHATGLI